MKGDVDCRKRKRMRSGRGWSSSASDIDSVELLVRLAGDDDLKTFVVKFDREDMKMLSNTKLDYRCYSGHDHSSSANPERFRSLRIISKYLSALPRAVPLCYTATLGSTVYAINEAPFHRFDFMCMDLDVDPDISEDEKWKQLPSPTSTGCQLHYLVKLVALRGSIFLLGGDPIALRFDPATNSWSKIEGVNQLVTRSIVFNTSLGESSGKLLFYDDRSSLSPIIYIYDVVHERVDTYAAHFFEDIVLVDNHVVRNPVVKQQDKNTTTVYWLLKKGIMYAFDWDAKVLYSGPVLGMESEHLVNMLKHCDVSFCHLTGDLFCLFWTATMPDETQPDGYKSYCHYTVLKVIEDDFTSTLTAYVVGCYLDPIPRFFCGYEASSLPSEVLKLKRHEWLMN